MAETTPNWKVEEQTPATPAPTPKQYFSGIVKQVMDGGVVVIRGPVRNGPPAERILALTNIDAPKLGRRPTPTQAATEDEPYAWEAREFLRKMLVGKSILGHVVHTANREYGVLLLGTNPETAEDVATKLVVEGLAKVRENCQDQKLKDAQETAKTEKKGVWSGEMEGHTRKIVWEVENPRQLVDKMAGKQVPAIVEHVRDGSTLRVFLLPDFYHITLMMSGVRCPATRLGPEGRPDPSQCEAYAVEAHYFTESRLLQRDVEVVIETHNNNNFIGSVIHPAGNIAEALLKEGMAKIVDWSIAKVPGGPEKYRETEKIAQDGKLRIWKNFTPSETTINPKDREFVGKVVEIVNGDALMVKAGKVVKKVHLASIRPPRQENNAGDRTRMKGFRPLYDIPFMFEAREFLRKKLIGHTVNVKVNYIQPAKEADMPGELPFPEKTCCTVLVGGVNVAEALVSKGLATVVRYAADNDQRSANYDDLLQAEEKAKKSSTGLHDKKNIPTHRVSDMTGNLAKCKQFLPFLQRAGRMQGLVEFVASGSRFRVYIPRETCLVTFLLGGINCPKGARMLPSGDRIQADPFGEEAALWVKEQVLQREVEIEVESMDKAGNFIGYLFFDGQNLNVNLVQEGFATCHFTAERSAYGNQIKNAEDNARQAKKKVWVNYTGEEEHEAEKEAMEALTLNEERKVNYEDVVVTEVTDDGKIYAQSVADGPAVEKLMDNLREEFTTNPPLSGAYQPKRNEMCAAKFIDGQWYRAKIEKISGPDVIVCYIDYGNKATIPKSQVASLPSSFHSPTGYAKVYSLALCQLAPDEELAQMGIAGLKEDLLNNTVKLNHEYRMSGESFVTMATATGKDDIGMGLVHDGLLMVDKKGGRKLAKLLKQYEEAMDFAKKQHLHIWQYGDITADDAREFGIGRQ
jgi:staphylococcal nuclease domain-containing protein 1